MTRGQLPCTVPRMSHSVFRLVRAACVGIVLIAPAHARAQSAGSIAGTVVDTSGAAVPGATVALTHQGTGTTTTTATTRQGTFVVPQIPPGAYSVEARLEGFRTAIVIPVTVHVDTRVSLDLVLEPGTINETVRVEGRLNIDRASPGVGTVVDRQFIGNLPLNGRSFHTLLELTPGVVMTKPSITSPGQFSVNGQRGNANYFMVDGVGANVGSTPVATFSQQATGTLPAFTISGGTNALVSSEALEEFKLQTSSYAPEFGRSPGGQVSLVTRSGTNRLTGSAFEYYRDEVFDANDWFNNRLGIEKLKLDQHQFGGVLGGPVRVPGYDGRGRTFFFASYEGLRLTQPQNVSFALVPSRDARRLATGVLKELYDSYPLGNTASDPSDPAFTERYRVATSFPSRFDASSLRLDQQAGTRLRLFGRVNHTPSQSKERAFAHSINGYQLNLTTTTIGATWTMSPRLVSDTRVNYSYSRGLFSWDQAIEDGSVAPDLTQLLPGYATLSNARISFQPMQAAGFGGNRVPGNFSGGKAVGNAQQQWNVVHTDTFVAGTHELKAGFDYRRLNPRADLSSYGFTYVFRSVEEALQTNAPTQVSVTAFSPDTHFVVHNLSAFVQDTWRATPRFTVSYGTRYEVNPSPQADPLLPYTFLGLDTPLTMTLAPENTRLWKTQWGNLAPRFGVSYVASERFDLVVRGGVGIYYDLGVGMALRGYSSFPAQATRTIASPGPLPVADAILQPLSRNTAPPYSTEFYVADPDLELPYSRQWNVALEKGLGRSQAFTASYVGSQGRRLLRTEGLANVPANASLGTPAITALNPALFGTSARVYITRNAAESSYHALQLQYRRRMQRGVQVLASYTLSSSRDNVSDESLIGSPVGGPPGFPIDPKGEFGPSDFDARHNVVGSVTWSLPSPRAGVARAVLGGWGLDAIGRYHSATPLTVIVATTDPLNTGVTVRRRANLVAGVDPWIDDSAAPGGRRLNPATFSVPAPGRQGDQPRNSLRAFPLRQIDLSVRREFGLPGQARLQLRIDAFNVLNLPNFGDPVVSLTGSPFGEATGMASSQLGTASQSVGFNRLYQMGGPRSMQASLKVLF